MTAHPLHRLRARCLALPEASEKTSWGVIPTFRVRDKIFAQVEDDHHGSGHIAVWCKARSGVPELLAESHPDRHFRPPYLAHLGWIGIRLDIELSADDWDEIADLIDDSYRLAAPKRLPAALGAGR